MNLEANEPLCDQVTVHFDGDQKRDMSFEEFLTVPLSTRIRYVIERRARFFAQGSEIDSHAALSRLRKARAVG